MKKTAVKGTSDYLPKEAALRDYIQNIILQTYQSNGFERIMTPAPEDIENLDKSEGGENLNLIFKIMKRGEKLSSAIAEGKYNELSDIGLRYDLTLPLSRYFANNRTKLILPIKCIQIDKVYCAERPQKGRLREFVQCDIDIIGSESIYSEIELINITAKALLALDIKDFKIKINDRGVLKSMLLRAGFEEGQLDSVCITIDKLDKVGIEGVKVELLEKQLSETSINNLVDILKNLPLKIEDLKGICDDTEKVRGLETIINTITKLADGKYTIEFDTSLLRGQGYYTGTVFEIESSDFKGAIAGGGRYDNLIGKFLDERVPAVGFSIGFERIFSIMLDKNYVIPNSRKRIAVLYDADTFLDANYQAERLKSEFDVVIYEKPKKLGKFLNRLKENGFYGFYNCGQSEAVSVLD